MTELPHRAGSSFWQHLRRRKVVQWGVAYAAGAWLVLQVFGFAADAFGWPAIAKQLAMLALAVVFPLALTLAWYHGDKGEQRISRSEFAILALLLLLGVGALWWFARREVPDSVEDTAPAADPASTVAADERSIAVLPFVNMSSDPEQEFFSDGISEQVLDLLSRVPELRVIARTSSFSFKGKDVDIATVARRLNVAHVLEGSVRKSGNRVRITTQLIRASDSSHLWSNTYDRELNDIFAVQDEIAAAVVRQLKVALLGGELPARSSATSLEAYNLYLKARFLFDQHTEQSMARAVEYYEASLSVDPAYAEAWAGLAEAQSVRRDEGYLDYVLGAEIVRAAAGRALELNPDLAKAHFALGLVQFSHDWDWAAAEASFDRAIALDSSETKALTMLGTLALISGGEAAGLELCRKAVANNPIGVYERLQLGTMLAQVGELDDAEEEFLAALELNPDFAQGWYFFGLTLLLKEQPQKALDAMQRETEEMWRLPGLPLAHDALGQRQESEAVLRDAKARYAQQMPYQIALVHAYRGEIDEAFAWLDRAYESRDTGLAWFLRTDPFLANLRGDPRYAVLLRRLKLPKEVGTGD